MAELPVARSGVYYVDDTRSGLKVRHHKRIPPDEIKNYTRKRKRMNKDELYAQLRLYGIDVSSGESADKLDEMLRAAIKAKKCATIPTHLVQLESKLLGEFKVKKEVYERESEARWEQQEKERRAANEILRAKRLEQFRKHKEGFAKLQSPAQEAEFDERLFFQKYFLRLEQGYDETDDMFGWHHDCTKGDIVTLNGISDQLLSRIFKRADGHSICTQVVRQGQAKSLILGWDRAAVYKAAHPKWTKEGVQDFVDLGGSRNEKVMAKHRILIRRNRNHKPSIFTLDHALGSYVIQCEKIDGGDGEDQYPESELEMNIFKDEKNDYGLIGQFRFTGYEGAMLLAMTRESLDRMCLAHRNPESESENESDMEERFSESWGAGRRLGGSADTKTKSISNAATKPSLKAKKEKPKNKKSLNENTIIRRLYFKWRGRCGEEIEVGESDSNDGYIDFTDNTCVNFTGKISLELYEKDLETNGYKIKMEPAGSIEHRWEDLCDWQHEAEITGRWGKWVERSRGWGRPEFGF